MRCESAQRECARERASQTILPALPLRTGANAMTDRRLGKAALGILSNRRIITYFSPQGRSLESLFGS